MNAASVLTGFGVLLASATGLQAAPQRPVGSALVVVNLVTAEYNRDTRSLQRGDRVHQDETIEVGLDGSSELKLDDDTKLALGPGSHLRLDKFVYDPDKSKGSIVLDLVKGTFRFITGVADKPTYVIKTPAAAITVRGTIFDVYVENDGLSWLLLHEGAVQVCNVRGQCKDLTEPGKIIRISDDGDVGTPSRWAGLNGRDRVPFDTAFPFVGKTPGIDPVPALTREAILLGTTDEKDDDDYVVPKSKDTTPRPPKAKKPPRKPRETHYEDRDDYPKKKKKRRETDNKEKVVKGLGTAIGIGLAIGAAKYYNDKQKPGGYGGGGYGRGKKRY